MKTMIGSMLLALLLQNQSCDLNEMAGKGPERIKNQAETELQRYFPDARVLVSTEDETVFGLTCTANLGRAVIEQMVPLIDQSAGVQQIKKFRKYAGLQSLAELLGFKFVTYRYFALGFDDYILRLDADTYRYDLLPSGQFLGYPGQYAEECGLNSPHVTDTSQPNNTYIWLGIFMLTIQTTQGDQTMQVVDTLGLYTEADFNRIREEEIEAREQLIHRFLTDQNIRVVSLQLERVDKIPTPASVASLTR